MTVLRAELEKVSRGFVRTERNGLAWVSAQRMLDAGAFHGCSTRRGGVSTAEGLAGLNLGWNRERDGKENVAENYRFLSSAAGFSYESMALVSYEHGGNVCIARKGDQGKGFGKGAFPPCDGLLSGEPEITMITSHADCLPIFLYDPTANVGGMLHAGWRGVALRIGERAVARLRTELGATRRNLLAAIGPAICQGHFEVDLPVVERFREAFSDIENLDDYPWLFYKEETGKYHIDLPYMMALQLANAGVPGENITLADLCTVENTEDFYSYRRDGKNCGSMAGFLHLRP